MYCNLVYLTRYLFSPFTSDFKITVSFILCYVTFTENEVTARTPGLINQQKTLCFT